MLLVSGLARRRRHGLCRGATDDTDDEANETSNHSSRPCQGRLRLGKWGGRVPASQPSDAACATRTCNVCRPKKPTPRRKVCIHLIFIRFQKQNNHTTTRPNQINQHRSERRYTFPILPFFSNAYLYYRSSQVWIPLLHVCPPKNNQPPTYRTTHNKAPPTAK